MNDYPKNWLEIAMKIKKRAGFRCEQCGHPHNIKDCYILTVHHINGDKADCRDENLIALCQRCHLRELSKRSEKIKYEDTPKEIRQKVLDLCHYGKSIKEIREELNLSFDQTCKIIIKNIKTEEVLGKEVI